MIRESYAPAEWRTLQMSFFWIHLAVANADGKIDAKETEAFTTEMKRWVQSSEPLVRELVLTFSMEVKDVLREFALDGRGAPKGLSDAADILDRKATPSQARELKATLLLIGQKVASASGGGMFGLGQKISEQEKSALTLCLVALRATDLLSSS